MATMPVHYNPSPWSTDEQYYAARASALLGQGRVAWAWDDFDIPVAATYRGSAVGGGTYTQNTHAGGQIRLIGATAADSYSIDRVNGSALTWIPNSGASDFYVAARFSCPNDRSNEYGAVTLLDKAAGGIRLIIGRVPSSSATNWWCYTTPDGVSFKTWEGPALDASAHVFEFLVKGGTGEFWVDGVSYGTNTSVVVNTSPVFWGAYMLAGATVPAEMKIDWHCEAFPSGSR